LLQRRDNRVQNVGSRRVFFVDSIVHIPHRGRNGLKTLGDEVDSFGRVDLTVRIRRQACGFRDRRAPAVRGCMQCPQPLSNHVAELTGIFDNFVKLQMQIAKVLTDDVPVCLFALKMQFNQVNVNALEIRGELRGRNEPVFGTLASRRPDPCAGRGRCFLRDRAAASRLG
jgi:hypothetical protein